MNKEMTKLRKILQEAIRLGPPELIGYGDDDTKAFNRGWNANAERLWHIAESIFDKAAQS